MTNLSEIPYDFVFTRVGCLQDAAGDLTEANFGTDDDTMGRLEDMGVPDGGLVGDDVARQKKVSTAITCDLIKQHSVCAVMTCDSTKQHNFCAAMTYDSNKQHSVCAAMTCDSNKEHKLVTAIICGSLKQAKHVCYNDLGSIEAAHCGGLPWLARPCLRTRQNLTCNFEGISQEPACTAVRSAARKMPTHLCMLACMRRKKKICCAGFSTAAAKGKPCRCS